MTAHHIKLQSSVGDFSPEFVERLPVLEKAMRDHGLDPSAFVIARKLAQSTFLQIAFRPDGNLLEYTVFVKDRSFTVTQPNDMRASLSIFMSSACPRSIRAIHIRRCIRPNKNWTRCSAAPRAGSTNRFSNADSACP
jgi:hypothetical protein